MKERYSMAQRDNMCSHEEAELRLSDVLRAWRVGQMSTLRDAKNCDLALRREERTETEKN